MNLYDSGLCLHTTLHDHLHVARCLYPYFKLWFLVVFDHTGWLGYAFINSFASEAFVMSFL